MINTIPGYELPPGWEIKTLGDITTKIGSGSTPRGGASVYIDSGTSLIRSQNIYDHQFIMNGLAHIFEDVADSMRGVTVKENDVLINITGDSILRTTIVPKEVLPARVNQHVAIVRLDHTMSPVFVQKWLSSPVMKSFMLNHSSGGTRKAITKGHLESFAVPVPAKKDQDRIAHVLETLDDKIESNQRQIKILHQLAFAIFESSDFSGSKELGEIAKVTMGSSPQGSSLNEVGVGKVFYQGTRDFGFRYPKHRVWTTEPIRMANQGDTLVAVRAPVGTLNRAPERLCIGRGLAAVGSEFQSLVFYALLDAVGEFEPYNSEGTVFGAINKKAMNELQVRWPKDPESVDQKLRVFDDVLSCYTKQIDLLKDLRGTLLPELLTGRITPEQLEAGL